MLSVPGANNNASGIKKRKGDVTMKFCSLFSIVFIVSRGLCAFGQGKDPNAAEILLRYKKSLLWSQSVSMRIKATVDVDANHPNKEFFPSKVDFIFRQDHDRAEWLGQRLLFDDEGKVDRLNSRVIKQISTGEFFLDVSETSPFAAFPRAAVVNRDYKELQENVLDSSDLCGPIFGKLPGINHKGIAGLLGESNNLRLHDKQESVNGMPCYVLEATTKYGRVTAWTAPEKGYNALKWVFEKGPSDLFDKTLVSLKWPETTSISMFDSAEVQEVKNVFITTGGCLTHTVNFADGRKYVSYEKYKVSEVEINPDFEALGAFKVDLPNGTRVFVMEFPGVRYIWQDGKKASRGKVELQELIKKIELEKPPRPHIGLSRIVLPVLSILVAGIVLTGLVLLKKKASSRSK